MGVNGEQLMCFGSSCMEPIGPSVVHSVNILAAPIPLIGAVPTTWILVRDSFAKLKKNVLIEKLSLKKAVCTGIALLGLFFILQNGRMGTTGYHLLGID